jgi:hypothetical protein
VLAAAGPDHDVSPPCRNRAMSRSLSRGAVSVLPMMLPVMGLSGASGWGLGGGQEGSAHKQCSNRQQRCCLTVNMRIEECSLLSCNRLLMQPCNAPAKRQAHSIHCHHRPDAAARTLSFDSINWAVQISQQQ